MATPDFNPTKILTEFAIGIAHVMGSEKTVFLVQEFQDYRSIIHDLKYQQTKMNFFLNPSVNLHLIYNLMG